MEADAARKLLEGHLPDHENFRLIGQGSFALVFRARPRDEDRDVAIKLLDTGHSTAAKERERFALEIRYLERIHHENVVQILDFGRVGRHDFLIQELVEGRNLKEILSGPMAPRLIFDIFRGIARGLMAIHRENILHRDLKPENILIRDRDGVPKITDFGLAKSLTDPDPRLTAAGMCLGTPVYMAPEVCLAREPGAAADVYSLGVMLHEALTGNPPYMAENEMDVFKMHVTTPVPVIPPRGDVIFDGLAVLAAACLRKEPELRPRDGGDLLERLTRLEEGRAPENRQSLRLRVNRHRRGKIGRWIDFSLWKGLAAGILTGVLVILLLAWGTRPAHVAFERGGATLTATWATRWACRGRLDVRSPGGDWRPMIGGKGNLHRLEVTDLTPGTAYQLRVRDALGWWGDETEVTTLAPLEAVTRVRHVAGGWEIAVTLDRPAAIRLTRAGQDVAGSGETEVTSWETILPAPDGPLRAPGSLVLIASGRREAPLVLELSPRTLLQALAELSLEKEVPEVGRFAWAPLDEVDASRMGGLIRGVPPALARVWELARAEEEGWKRFLEGPGAGPKLIPHLPALEKLGLIDRAAGLWGFPRRFDPWTAAIARLARPLCVTDPGEGEIPGGSLSGEIRVRLLQREGHRNLTEMLLVTQQDGETRSSLEGELSLPPGRGTSPTLGFWVLVDRLEPQAALSYEVTAGSWTRRGHLHDPCTEYPASQRNPGRVGVDSGQMGALERRSVLVGVRLDPPGTEATPVRYRLSPVVLPGCVPRLPPMVFRVGLSWMQEGV